MLRNHTTRGGSPITAISVIGLRQISGEMNARTKFLYRALALSAVAAGSLGLLLPVLPTVPFLLVALWAAARGAPELHGRIRHHPRFKSVLDAWEHERAVPTRAKWTAVAVMSVSFTLAWWREAPAWLLIVLGLLFASISTFLLSRPASRGNAHETD